MDLKKIVLSPYFQLLSQRDKLILLRRADKEASRNAQRTNSRPGATQANFQDTVCVKMPAFHPPRRKPQMAHRYRHSGLQTRFKEALQRDEKNNRQKKGLQKLLEKHGNMRLEPWHKLPKDKTLMKPPSQTPADSLTETIIANINFSQADLVKCPVCRSGVIPKEEDVVSIDLNPYIDVLFETTHYTRSCPLCQCYVSPLTLDKLLTHPEDLPGAWEQHDHGASGDHDYEVSEHLQFGGRDEESGSHTRSAAVKNHKRRLSESRRDLADVLTVRQMPVKERPPFTVPMISIEEYHDQPESTQLQQKLKEGHEVPKTMDGKTPTVEKETPTRGKGPGKISRRRHGRKSPRILNRRFVPQAPSLQVSKLSARAQKGFDLRYGSLLDEWRSGDEQEVMAQDLENRLLNERKTGEPFHQMLSDALPNEDLLGLLLQEAEGQQKPEADFEVRSAGDKEHALSSSASSYALAESLSASTTDKTTLNEFDDLLLQESTSAASKQQQIERGDSLLDALDFIQPVELPPSTFPDSESLANILDFLTSNEELPTASKEGESPLHALDLLQSEERLAAPSQDQDQGRPLQDAESGTGKQKRRRVSEPLCRALDSQDRDRQKKRRWTELKVEGHRIADIADNVASWSALDAGTAAHRTLFSQKSSDQLLQRLSLLDEAQLEKVFEKLEQSPVSSTTAVDSEKARVSIGAVSTEASKKKLRGDSLSNRAQVKKLLERLKRRSVSSKTELDSKKRRISISDEARLEEMLERLQRSSVPSAVDSNERHVGTGDVSTEASKEKLRVDSLSDIARLEGTLERPQRSSRSSMTPVDSKERLVSTGVVSAEASKEKLRADSLFEKAQPGEVPERPERRFVSSKTALDSKERRVSTGVVSTEASKEKLRMDSLSDEAQLEGTLERPQHSSIPSKTAVEGLASTGVVSTEASKDKLRVDSLSDEAQLEETLEKSQRSSIPSKTAADLKEGLVSTSVVSTEASKEELRPDAHSDKAQLEKMLERVQRGSVPSAVDSKERLVGTDAVSTAASKEKSGVDSLSDEAQLEEMLERPQQSPAPSGTAADLKLGIMSPSEVTQETSKEMMGTDSLVSGTRFSGRVKKILESHKALKTGVDRQSEDAVTKGGKGALDAETPLAEQLAPKGSLGGVSVNWREPLEQREKVMSDVMKSGKLELWKAVPSLLIELVTKKSVRKLLTLAAGALKGEELKADAVYLLGEGQTLKGEARTAYLPSRPVSTTASPEEQAQEAAYTKAKNLVLYDFLLKTVKNEIEETTPELKPCLEEIMKELDNQLQTTMGELEDFQDCLANLLDDVFGKVSDIVTEGGGEEAKAAAESAEGQAEEDALERMGRARTRAHAYSSFELAEKIARIIQKKAQEMSSSQEVKKFKGVVGIKPVTFLPKTPEGKVTQWIKHRKQQIPPKKEEREETGREEGQRSPQSTLSERFAKPVMEREQEISSAASKPGTFDKSPTDKKSWLPSAAAAEESMIPLKITEAEISILKEVIDENPDPRFKEDLVTQVEEEHLTFNTLMELADKLIAKWKTDRRSPAAEETEAKTAISLSPEVSSRGGEILKIETSLAPDVKGRSIMKEGDEIDVAAYEERMKSLRGLISSFVQVAEKTAGNSKEKETLSLLKPAISGARGTVKHPLTPVSWKPRRAVTRTAMKIKTVMPFFAPPDLGDGKSIRSGSSAEQMSFEEKHVPKMSKFDEKMKKIRTRFMERPAKADAEAGASQERPTPKPAGKTHLRKLKRAADKARRRHLASMPPQDETPEMMGEGPHVQFQEEDTSMKDSTEKAEIEEPPLPVEPTHEGDAGARDSLHEAESSTLPGSPESLEVEVYPLTQASELPMAPHYRSKVQAAIEKQTARGKRSEARGLLREIFARGMQKAKLEGAKMADQESLEELHPSRSASLVVRQSSQPEVVPQAEVSVTVREHEREREDETLLEQEADVRPAASTVQPEDTESLRGTMSPSVETELESEFAPDVVETASSEVAAKPDTAETAALGEETQHENLEPPTTRSARSRFDEDHMYRVLVVDLEPTEASPKPVPQVEEEMVEEKTVEERKDSSEAKETPAPRGRRKSGKHSKALTRLRRFLTAVGLLLEGGKRRAALAKVKAEATLREAKPAAKRVEYRVRYGSHPIRQIHVKDPEKDVRRWTVAGGKNQGLKPPPAVHPAKPHTPLPRDKEKHTSNTESMSSCQESSELLSSLTSVEKKDEGRSPPPGRTRSRMKRGHVAKPGRGIRGPKRESPGQEAVVVGKDSSESEQDTTLICTEFSSLKEEESTEPATLRESLVSAAWQTKLSPRQSGEGPAGSGAPSSCGESLHMTFEPPSLPEVAPDTAKPDAAKVVRKEELSFLKMLSPILQKTHAHAMMKRFVQSKVARRKTPPLPVSTSSTSKSIDAVASPQVSKGSSATRLKGSHGRRTPSAQEDYPPQENLHRGESSTGTPTIYAGAPSSHFFMTEAEEEEEKAGAKEEKEEEILVSKEKEGKKARAKRKEKQAILMSKAEEGEKAKAEEEKREEILMKAEAGAKKKEEEKILMSKAEEKERAGAKEKEQQDILISKAKEEDKVRAKEKREEDFQRSKAEVEDKARAKEKREEDFLMSKAEVEDKARAKEKREEDFQRSKAEVEDKARAKEKREEEFLMSKAEGEEKARAKKKEKEEFLMSKAEEKEKADTEEKEKEEFLKSEAKEEEGKVGAGEKEEKEEEEEEEGYVYGRAPRFKWRVYGNLRWTSVRAIGQGVDSMPSLEALGPAPESSESSLSETEEEQTEAKIPATIPAKVPAKILAKVRAKVQAKMKPRISEATIQKPRRKSLSWVLKTPRRKTSSWDLKTSRGKTSWAFTRSSLKEGRHVKDEDAKERKQFKEARKRRLMAHYSWPLHSFSKKTRPPVKKAYWAQLRLQRHRFVKAKRTDAGVTLTQLTKMVAKMRLALKETAKSEEEVWKCWHLDKLEFPYYYEAGEKPHQKDGRLICSELRNGYGLGVKKVKGEPTPQKKPSDDDDSSSTYSSDFSDEDVDVPQTTHSAEDKADKTVSVSSRRSVRSKEDTVKKESKGNSSNNALRLADESPGNTIEKRGEKAAFQKIKEFTPAPPSAPRVRPPRMRLLSSRNRSNSASKSTRKAEGFLEAVKETPATNSSVESQVPVPRGRDIHGAGTMSTQESNSCQENIYRRKISKGTPTIYIGEPSSLEKKAEKKDEKKWAEVIMPMRTSPEMHHETSDVCKTGDFDPKMLGNMQQTRNPSQASGETQHDPKSMVRPDTSPLNNQRGPRQKIRANREGINDTTKSPCFSPSSIATSSSAPVSPKDEIKYGGREKTTKQRPQSNGACARVETLAENRGTLGGCNETSANAQDGSGRPHSGYARMNGETLDENERRKCTSAWVAPSDVSPSGDFDFNTHFQPETLDADDVQPVPRHSSLFWLYSADIDTHWWKDRDPGIFENTSSAPSRLLTRSASVTTDICRPTGQANCTEDVSITDLSMPTESPVGRYGVSPLRASVSERLVTSPEEPRMNSPFICFREDPSASTQAAKSSRGSSQMKTSVSVTKDNIDTKESKPCPTVTKPHDPVGDFTPSVTAADVPTSRRRWADRFSHLDSLRKKLNRREDSSNNPLAVSKPQPPSKSSAGGSISCTGLARPKTAAMSQDGRVGEQREVLSSTRKLSTPSRPKTSALLLPKSVSHVVLNAPQGRSIGQLTRKCWQPKHSSPWRN